MADVAVPHLAFPPRLAGGHLATVEQDSEEDILACVYVALKTPIGSRPYVATFGVDDYTFSSPVPVSELRAQIQASEPRVTADIQSQINDLVETVIVGVSNVG